MKEDQLLGCQVRKANFLITAWYKHKFQTNRQRKACHLFYFVLQVPYFENYSTVRPKILWLTNHMINKLNKFSYPSPKNNIYYAKPLFLLFEFTWRFTNFSFALHFVNSSKEKHFKIYNHSIYLDINFCRIQRRKVIKKNFFYTTKRSSFIPICHIIWQHKSII